MCPHSDPGNGRSGDGGWRGVETGALIVPKVLLPPSVPLTDRRGAGSDTENCWVFSVESTTGSGHGHSCATLDPGSDEVSYATSDCHLDRVAAEQAHRNLQRTRWSEQGGALDDDGAVQPNLDTGRENPVILDPGAVVDRGRMGTTSPGCGRRLAAGRTSGDRRRKWGRGCQWHWRARARPWGWPWRRIVQASSTSVERMSIPVERLMTGLV